MHVRMCAHAHACARNVRLLISKRQEGRGESILDSLGEGSSSQTHPPTLKNQPSIPGGGVWGSIAQSSTKLSPNQEEGCLWLCRGGQRKKNRFIFYQPRGGTLSYEVLAYSRHTWEGWVPVTAKTKWPENGNFRAPPQGLAQGGGCQRLLTK